MNKTFLLYCIVVFSCSATHPGEVIMNELIVDEPVKRFYPLINNKNEGYKKGQFFLKDKGYVSIGSPEHKDYLTNFKTTSQKIATNPIGKLNEQKESLSENI